MHLSCKHDLKNVFGLMNIQQELSFFLTDETWKIFANVLYLSGLLLRRSKGGTLVRALAPHQCGPGSNPGMDTLCVG